MVSRISQVFISAALLALTVSILFPFLYLLAVSLTNETQLTNMALSKLSLESYRILLASNDQLLRAFGMSVIRTALGTLLNMACSVLLAYSLSKPAMPGRKGLTIYMIATMVFSGGLIPVYMIVTSLGLNNTIWSMVLPTLVSAYNVILLRNFFMDVPAALEESAKIDGASDWLVLGRIILPLSKPVLATITLFYAVYHWNEWFQIMLYVGNPKLWTIQVFLRNLIMESTQMDNMMQVGSELMSVSPESIKMATILVVTIPVAAVYPFVQKYFVSGIQLGAVKE
ncbi:carbohydrate ABC transporter permease [Paenibacillus sp. MBLB4367]|uniref:carbohydrate ABC transporter permease n=1 Tax=Paenibacillus sp. MBLB4367 TaxID=3384767 RepID=UPI003907E948